MRIIIYCTKLKAVRFETVILGKGNEMGIVTRIFFSESRHCFRDECHLVVIIINRKISFKPNTRISCVHTEKICAKGMECPDLGIGGTRFKGNCAFLHLVGGFFCECDRED